MLIGKGMRITFAAAMVIAASRFAALAQHESDRGLAEALDRALAAGQMDEGRQVLSQLLARPHVELEVLLETGAKLADREFFEPARAVFARGVTLYPRSFEARYNLALSDFALQKYSEAQTSLEGAEKLSRDQQLAREYLRGKIYDAQGQTKLAERSFS